MVGLVHYLLVGEGEAVEISVFTDVLREIRNVGKCLAAGYDRVLVLFVDETAIT